MSMKNLLGILCVTLGALSSATGAEQARAARNDGCVGFRFNLDRELALFAGKAERLVVQAKPEAAPDAAVAHLYEVRLLPQSQVRFAVAPDKVTVTEDSYAGVLRVLPKANGTLRVTIDDPSWIDVIENGELITSTNHTGSQSCKLFHKSVEYPVITGKPLLVQISGATAPTIKFAVTLN